MARRTDVALGYQPTDEGGADHLAAVGFGRHDGQRDMMLHTELLEQRDVALGVLAEAVVKAAEQRLCPQSPDQYLLKKCACAQMHQRAKIGEEHMLYADLPQCGELVVLRHQRRRILAAEHAFGALGKGHADGQQPVFFLPCRTGQHLAVTAVYAVKEAERHGGGFFFLE